jgi:type I restriction enzyme M protein
VQLIDATSWFKPLRKNMGKKNCELSAADLARIGEAFLNLEESEQSKIFPNEALGYWKMTVERPLRLRVDLTVETLARFRAACEAADEAPLANLAERLAAALGAGPHLDFNQFMQAVLADVAANNLKWTAKRRKLLQTELAQRDERAERVLRTSRKPKKGEQAAPLYGCYAIEHGSQPMLAEYEPDSELRDTEQVPLLEPGGTEAFFAREVLPYAPDAWIDRDATKIGYEISFTRYFYKPQPLPGLGELRAKLIDLEREGDGLLRQIVGGAA